jgi:hypothetical protein
MAISMPKLTQTQIARIRYIHRQIDRIIHESRRDTIEGVNFDLRHKLFDTTDWDVHPKLFKSRHLDTGGPTLVFPWTEDSELAGAQHEENNTINHEGDKFQSNELIIESGDRIYISHVDLVTSDGILRGCNLPRKQVYFSVKRNDGEDIKIDAPLPMIPKYEIWEHNFAGNFYSAIKGRIRNHFFVDDFPSSEKIKADDSFAYRALRKLNLLLRANGVDGMEVLSDSKHVVVLPIVSAEEYQDNSNIWLTINDAVALGYLWAKSEDEQNWVPFGGNVEPQQSVASRRSATVRGKSAEDWKRVYWERLAEIWHSATRKPTRSKMIDDVMSEKEQWDATKLRLGLPGATMRGRSSLEKAMLTRKQLREMGAKKG